MVSKNNIKLNNGFFWIAYPATNICSIISIHAEKDKVYFLGDSKTVTINGLLKMETEGAIEIIAHQNMPTILLNKHYQN